MWDELPVVCSMRAATAATPLHIQQPAHNTGCYSVLEPGWHMQLLLTFTFTCPFVSTKGVSQGTRVAKTLDLNFDSLDVC